jgi:hypothetical protein
MLDHTGMRRVEEIVTVLLQRCPKRKKAKAIAASSPGEGYTMSTKNTYQHP